MENQTVSMFIHDLTITDNGFRKYLSLDELVFMFYKIKEMVSLPEYISIIPFYEGFDFKEELEERILYIKCIENLTQKKRENFFSEVRIFSEPRYNIDIEERIFICDKHDIMQFKACCESCIKYIEKLIPWINHEIQDRKKINIDNTMSGRICFMVCTE